MSTNDQQCEKIEKEANERRLKRIRYLNDRFRRTGKGGIFLRSFGISALEKSVQDLIFQLIADFDNFNPDDDPTGEKRFGRIPFEGRVVLWYIIYTGFFHQTGDLDPADPKGAERLLDVSFASED